MLLAVALVAMVLGANAGAVDLTGKTFDAEVMESGKGAFIKFFAPWCENLSPPPFHSSLPPHKKNQHPRPFPRAKLCALVKFASRAAHERG
jgi:hypothetical protein